MMELIHIIYMLLLNNNEISLFASMKVSLKLSLAIQAACLNL
jgi:hypothetical protein